MTSDEVCWKLRDLILREEILPNERLIETAYAERFGTNRSIVRKALAALEREGLVVIEPFKGAHVRRITDKEAIEITEVRGALETVLIRYAAQRATEDDKASLRQALQAAQEVLQHGTPIEVGAAARRVREQMWRISGHETGRHIMSTLNSQLIRIWFHAILQPGRPQQIVEDVARVVRAIEANQPDDAIAAIHEYHERSLAALLLAIEGSRARVSRAGLPEATLAAEQRVRPGDAARP
jgi:DNA-binding GntR family transcriptional regulator